MDREGDWFRKLNKKFKKEMAEEARRDKEKPKRFKCNQCNFKSHTFNQLDFHMAKEHIYFKCLECDYKSHFDLHVTLHMQNKHPKLKCNKCGQLFKRESNLKVHLKKVHGDLPYVTCPWCKNNYADKQQLREHVCSVTYKCSQCPMRTHNLGQLKAHCINHHGAKPEEGLITCTVCGFTTTKLKYLKAHALKRHTAAKHENPEPRPEQNHNRSDWDNTTKVQQQTSTSNDLIVNFASIRENINLRNIM